MRFSSFSASYAGHSSSFIAPPDSWPELREGFEGWVEGLG